MNEEQNVPDDAWIKPTVPQSSEKFEPRGIGDVYVKDPIACVLEVLNRLPDADGKVWTPVPPMSEGAGQKVSFAIMNAVTTKMVKAGTIMRPGRETHPAFAKFNYCHPDLASTVHAKIIHFDETDAWKFHLGAYKSPNKNESPSKGWWCRGDSKIAERFIKGEFRQITCPNRLCEFSLPQWGPKRNAPHCKPKITLIAQFNWKEGSQLPKMIFQWNSQSWNGYGSLEGMFKLIRTTSLSMGWGEKFPVFGLPITMSVKKKVAQGKQYPEVHFSVDGDLMAWMGSVRQMMEQGQMAQIANGPPPMRQLPPAGMTQDDVDRATEATLNPNYLPSNER